MRKTWLRGRKNVEKRHLLHIAGFNLGLLMRKLTGYGTPKGAADVWNLIFVGFKTANCWMWLVFVAHEDRPDEWLPVGVVSKRDG